jgi:hypothetical protein
MSAVSEVKPMKGKRKGYLLHIDEGLWKDLNEWANLEFRSVNGQMECILQRAVNDWKKRRPKDIKEDAGLE